MKKHGFTLIELVVTISLAGIFSTFAMEYYLQAIKANNIAAKRNSSYFEYNVSKNILKNVMVRYLLLCFLNQVLEQDLVLNLLC